MFSNLVLISNKGYKIYKRHKSTHVIALPNEYAIFKNYQKGQYLYCFLGEIDKKEYLCYSDIEIAGTKKVMIVSVNENQFRLTVPAIYYNWLNNSDDCSYKAYHNKRGLLVFKKV